MSEHLFNGVFIGTSKHDQAHSIACSLSNDGGVSIVEESIFKLIIDGFVVGGHGSQAETETDTMLNSLVLPTVSESLKEVVNHILIVLVSINQSIGIVSSSCREWRVAALLSSINPLACEVRIEDCHGLLFVTHVDHAKGSSGIEAIPVSCLCCPGKIVSEEAIVSSVCIHDTISPESRPVENRTLRIDLFFDLSQDQHITVVILFEELKVESVANLSSQDGFELLESLGLFRVAILRS